MKRIAPSELILNSDGSIFHLHLTPEQLANNIILVGDPGRVESVSKFFDTIEFEKSSREFHSSTGVYKGKRITALSTGIGADNIDIVMNELDALVNIDFESRRVKSELTELNILRIGTSGSIQPQIELGSFVLSHISAGFDALLNWYGNRDEVSNSHMERAFIEHMGWNEILPKPYFVEAAPSLIEKLEDFTIKGLTVSAAGFYAPQGRVLRLPLVMEEMLERLESFRYDNYKITNFEMEGAAIAGLAKLMGHRAATICLIIANRYAKESVTDYQPYIDSLILNCLERL
ncbi:MAG: nucleoside phosphorylase [Bacteroidales bacterium]